MGTQALTIVLVVSRSCSIFVFFLWFAAASSLQFDFPYYITTYAHYIHPIIALKVWLQLVSLPRFKVNYFPLFFRYINRPLAKGSHKGKENEGREGAGEAQLCYGFAYSINNANESLSLSYVAHK